MGGPEAENWARVQRFSQILQSVQTGPLTYRAEDNLSFGQSWNTLDNYRSGKSFSTSSSVIARNASRYFGS